jgi:O-acetylhomoserine (thiol)-lyase
MLVGRCARSFFTRHGFLQKHLGEAKPLACHLASTTHRQVPAEEQRHAGITPEIIWINVGIEHIEAFVADLDQTLRVAEKY